MISSHEISILMLVQSFLFGILWIIAPSYNKSAKFMMRFMGVFNLLLVAGLIVLIIRGEGESSSPTVSILHTVSNCIVITALASLWQAIRIKIVRINLYRLPALWAFTSVLAVSIATILGQPLEIQRRVFHIAIFFAVFMMGIVELFYIERKKRKFLHFAIKIVAAFAVSVLMYMGLKSEQSGLDFSSSSVDIGHSISAMISYFIITAINALMAFSLVRGMMAALDRLSRTDYLTSLLNRRATTKSLFLFHIWDIL
ncbi:hypothetical protein OGM23_03350 [Dickeya fangzhongdai]|uniref:hypothetical protein n=1 Tax=Dickeya fangzhongdai TaxID=1778540 RepID=UPI002B2A6E42|nr:hypothetical protein OGM23_03350 [Dickeya fangzhongdai]